MSGEPHLIKQMQIFPKNLSIGRSSIITLLPQNNNIQIKII